MDLIGDLELMQELAELGSFSAVGRKRGQAASSVARRLDRLEIHLGERLFNRTPTGLFLSATGARKLIEARALTAAAAAFVEHSHPDGQLGGHLAVTAPSRLGQVCVAPVVADFLARHPAVSIDLHLTDMVQDLDRDRIDLAVRIGGITAEHHLIRRIADNHRVLVAAPGYLEARSPLAAVEQLNDCDGLMLGATESWKLRDRMRRVQSVHPRARLRCVAGDTLLAMAERGLGVALKSFWDVREAVAEGRLVHILPDWSQADPADIMIVMPDRRLLSPTLKTFSKSLEMGLKQLLAER
ncbi:MAG: LysR family transcriptional regulator [Hoeflea sp.]|nr:LysR family transcriptional regulator [Hoeflea sp.]